MRTEIEKYRDDKADYYGFQVPYDGTKDFYNKDKVKGFQDGFDTCMDLRLGEKFCKWIGDNCSSVYNGTKKKEGWMLVNDFYTDTELYDYWLNNVFKVQEGDARMLSND